MIKLDYCMDDDLRKWYCRNIWKVIKNKRKNIESTEQFSDFADILKNLSYEQMENILLYPRERLEKINWIFEYLKLADFVSQYTLFKKCCQKTKNCKGKKLIKERINNNNIKKYDGIYLKKLHMGQIELCSSSWDKYDDIKSKATNLLNNLNSIVSKVINYSFIDTLERRKLFSKMDVRTCPYCNQSYISITDDGKYLGDIDHVWPQKYYTLFSLSLWNLVPSCKACNQSLKQDKVIKILNPTQCGFGKQALFKVKCNSIASIRGESEDFEYGWKIQADIQPELAEKIENNIIMFHLNDKDDLRKKKIKDIMNKKYHFDKQFIEDYKKKLHIELDDDLYYSIYGCSLNPSKFKYEIFAKMTYDLIKNE